MATDGQIYWSDTHQLADYLDNYHAGLDRQLASGVKGTEMISELYVPRSRLAGLHAAVRGDAIECGFDIIYGTVRLIERDHETVLAWAREPWACVVFNLHVDHTPEGIARAGDHFRRLIDRAIEQNGSYYLTYHRWATAAQARHCHPRLVEFLDRKRAYGPRWRVSERLVPASHNASGDSIMRRTTTLLARGCAGVHPRPPGCRWRKACSAEKPKITHELRLRDGSRVYGCIASESDTEVEFETIAGVRLVARRDQIVSLRRAQGRLHNGEFQPADPNNTRLFFGPTGRALPRGQVYLGMYEFVMPFVQVGITDRFSIGGGTPLVFGLGTRIRPAVLDHA